MTVKKPALRALPTESGLLSASGARWLEASNSSALHVVVDDHAELCAVLLDLFHIATSGPGTHDPSGLPRARAGSDEAVADGLLQQVESVVLDALLQRAPLYELISSLRRFCATRAACQVGISLLRFSQRDSRVEVLNAGMPAIMCVLPDSEIMQHPALSGRVGQNVGEVHAYELCPLVWGSTWLAMSEAFTKAQVSADQDRHVGKQEPAEERQVPSAQVLHTFDAGAWLSEQGVFYDTHLLAREAPERLRRRMHSVRGPVPAESAALLCVSASSEPRF